ncbi:MAG: PEGA domain-containing protein [Planctomycetota bacterium]
MKQRCLLTLCLCCSALLSGCVERTLTINTQPQGAQVILNDEEIGVSPVTVAFEWYGHYNVTIRKDGFQTLKTHRNLKAPWYDAFPFDFFAGVLSADRIVDDYEWTFDLAPRQEITREELIRSAQQLKEQL